jgi:hypothetical protein
MRIVGIGIVVAFAVLCSAGAARAQEAPKAAAAAKADAPPQVAPEAKDALDRLNTRAQGLVDARAVLQKELDAVIADFSRVMQQLAQQAPEGYVFDGKALAYVKKPADATKKDGPPVTK